MSSQKDRSATLEGWEPVPTDELERARDRWTASSRGDMEPMLERFAADCELHSRVAELEGEGGVFHGHEGLRAFARELRETLGQVAFDLREMRRRGGLTLMIGRTTGRGSGSGVNIDVPIVWLSQENDAGRVVWTQAFGDLDQALTAAVRREAG